MRVDKTVFDGIASGEVNPVAAVLRGSMGMEGDRELLVLFQRLFPRTYKEEQMNDDLVKILDGNTFVVSDSRGDIEASSPIRRVCSPSTPASSRRGS